MEINGKKVINAKKKIVLHITDNDVKNGNTKDPAGCAAARACLRELGAKAARVHLGRTYVQIGDAWHRFHTSPALRSEIVAFDRGGTFEPGEYELNPMPPSHRPNGKMQGTKKGTNIPKTKRVKVAKRKYHNITGVRAHGANR